MAGSYTTRAPACFFSVSKFVRVEKQDRRRHESRGARPALLPCGGVARRGGELLLSLEGRVGLRDVSAGSTRALRALD